MLNYWPQSWAIAFSFLPLRGLLQNLLFSNLARETDRCQAVNMARYQDMLSGVVLLPFGYLVEVNQLCTQFGRFDSRYMPLGVDRLRSRSGSNARLT